MTVVVSIKDVKALTFLAPQTFANTDVAKRAVSQAISSPGSVLHDYPEDFELYVIGSFDDTTGEIVKDFKFVCNLKELVHE